MRISRGIILLVSSFLLVGCGGSSSEANGDGEGEENSPVLAIEASEVSEVIHAYMWGEEEALDHLVVNDRNAALAMIDSLRSWNRIIEEDEIALRVSGGGGSDEARTVLRNRKLRRDALKEHIGDQWSSLFGTIDSDLVGEWTIDRKAMEQKYIEEAAARHPDDEQTRQRVVENRIRLLESEYDSISLRPDGSFDSSDIFPRGAWSDDGYWEPTEDGVRLHPLIQPPTARATSGGSRIFKRANDHLMWAEYLFHKRN